MRYQQNHNRNPEPSNRQLLIILGIFVGFFIIIFWLFNLLISGLIGLIPPSLERQLGAAIVPIYEQQAESSLVQDKLNQLLDRLESNLPIETQKQRDYRVLYIPKQTVNALAIPGDVIIIYQGLLAQMASENELMMVLGHELGHFYHRDHLRGLGRAILVKLAIAYLIGDASALQSTVSTAVSVISNAQYSQSQESQADEFGLELLNSTYSHVAGATDFFNRLSQKKRVDIAFLASHPSPPKRVKHLEKLIAKRSYKIGVKQPLPQILQ